MPLLAVTQIPLGDSARFPGGPVKEISIPICSINQVRLEQIGIEINFTNAMHFFKMRFLTYLNGATHMNYSMNPLAADIKATFSSTITERREALLFLTTLESQNKSYHFDDSIDDCLSHVGAQERSIIEARVADCFKVLTGDICPFSVLCALSNSEHTEDNDDNRTNYVQIMAELIAPVFCDIVQRDLADDLSEIIERNKRYDDDVCATHDFCDANELMHDAATMFNVNVGGTLDGAENTMMELNHQAWGKAWGMAKAAEFKSETAIAQLA